MMTGLALVLAATPSQAQQAVEEQPEVRRNVVFNSVDGVDVALDIYLPAGESQEPRQVCLYIHGGGWQGGDKSEGEIFLRGPVQAGWVGISTSYRLSGQATWPAQIDDVHDCLEWISRHAEEIGADPNRIVVAGGSAGGHLALMAGLDQRSWRKYSIIGTFSLYGPTDLLADEWHFHQIRYMLVNLLGGDPLEDPSLARDASPLNYADKRDVPVFMVHGDEDSIVPYSQSVAMQELLGSLGVECRLLRVPGGNHGNFDETDPDWTEIARQFLEWSNRLAGVNMEVVMEEPASTQN
ncbi:alpha/beta hydrolase [bacterium]|nr:alpha/beta hydrolase [bacterium]